MNKKEIKTYKIIGQVQSAIAKAESLDEALQKALKIVLEESSVDYAVVWLADGGRSNVLHPYFWLCPVDFSSRSHKIGKGIVGRVYESQLSERYLDSLPKDSDFKGLDVDSMICVPLSNKKNQLGCIEFLNKKNSDPITDDDADICEILSMIIALGIEENSKLQGKWKKGKAIIKVRDIKKSYKNGDTITQVLKGVNMDVYEGEFLALLGESGCGKSTLLNIIGGLDKADSGEFTFMGKDMIDATQEELTAYRRDNIGFIFQSYNLMPNLNSRQNLDLIGELVKDPMDSQKALELVGLGEKMANYPSQLSGGQQQRISIARSLIKNPKMIFADEPTAALDYETSITVLSVLEKIAKSGTTLVMVTHNEEITKMADRVIRFRDGRMYEVTINRHPLHAEDLVW